MWFVTASLMMIVLVGLGVDLGGRVHALQQIRDVAAQAARTGGQRVLAGAAADGDPMVADPTAAIAAARSYLAAAGVDGQVTVTGGGTLLEVTATGVYEPTILSVIGIGAMPVTGHAQVALVRVVDGSPR